MSLMQFSACKAEVDHDWYTSRDTRLVYCYQLLSSSFERTALEEGFITYEFREFTPALITHTFNSLDSVREFIRSKQAC